MCLDWYQNQKRFLDLKAAVQKFLEQDDVSRLTDEKKKPLLDMRKRNKYDF